MEQGRPGFGATARTAYSVELCRQIWLAVERAKLLIPHRPTRYEEGDLLRIEFLTAWPEQPGQAQLRIQKYAGSGFAGQVYRCIAENVRFSGSPPNPIPLREGGMYAVKLFVPASRFARSFRNLLFWLGFQAPFSPQISEAACRAGVLWQKLARLAAARELGDENAVADVFATFYDPILQSFGEIREWVEGRFWRLEADTRPWLRRKWRRIRPAQTDSPEYVAKRQFMHRLVTMLHAMGALELARQFEWWTMKSQPNILKRTGHDADPAAGLCAFDFRPGLVLLFFLPMSPGDLKLIWQALRRGLLVQFDRCEVGKMRAFVAAHRETFAGADKLLEQWERYYLDSQRIRPDLFHHTLRLLCDPSLRRDVRRGLVQGYRAADLIDEPFAKSLSEQPIRFAIFYALGAIPVGGRLLRKIWGNRSFRQHLKLIFTQPAYLWRTLATSARTLLTEWHRNGRTGEKHTRLLLRHPWLFWLERITLGLLPAALHRTLAEPAWLGQRLKAAWLFMHTFYRDSTFRQDWLTHIINQGYEEGMLSAEERDGIMRRLADPFIATYLKCLAVHFATLPVTQIVSVLLGMAIAIWTLITGGNWQLISIRFAATLVVFQVIPISPGSLCRGAYVVYRMIRDRNFKDYMIAAPLSFVKYIGYLAFPIQMAATYPALARFMAGRWATNSVRLVPVFGERGALLEHIIFDAFFNLPRIVARPLARHIKGVLNLWLCAGLALCGIAFGIYRIPWQEKSGINLIMAVVALFVLPRVLFYPILTRKKRNGH
ncbi:MAG: hypothetical protein ACUVWX_13960 [Kiritimatiellia bacterium]